MKHARNDYNRIQDPAGKIPADEPVFLIRGQDENAPRVVAYWAMLAERGGADQEIVRAAKLHATAMADWQAEHGRKVPDQPPHSAPLTPPAGGPVIRGSIPGHTPPEPLAAAEERRLAKLAKSRKRKAR